MKISFTLAAMSALHLSITPDETAVGQELTSSPPLVEGHDEYALVSYFSCLCYMKKT